MRKWAASGRELTVTLVVTVPRWVGCAEGSGSSDYRLHPFYRLTGVLGARSAWRSRLRAREPETPVSTGRWTTDATSSRTNWLWAELMQRSFGFDVLACPRCGDLLELIALIKDP